MYHGVGSETFVLLISMMPVIDYSPLHKLWLVLSSKSPAPVLSRQQVCSLDTPCTRMQPRPHNSATKKTLALCEWKSNVPLTTILAPNNTKKRF
jgi:hypothetical protein